MQKEEIMNCCKPLRTFIPAAVGVLTGLAAKQGLDMKDPVVIAVMPLVSPLYYSVIHELEHKYPKLGLLLGTINK